MAKPNSRVGDILLRAGVIDELQLRSALAQFDQWGGRLGKIVADMGLADEDTIASAIAKATGLPRVQVGHTRDVAALGKLDAAFCEKHGVFPVQLKDNGKTLVLAMADPTPLDVVDEVAKRSRARVVTTVAAETEILHAIARQYRNEDPTAATDSLARQAVRNSGGDPSRFRADEQEFSVTEMGPGLRSSSSQRSSAREPELDPSELATDPGMGTRGAAAMLEEMLTAAPPEDQLTAEEKARIESVRLNQAKSTKILRAVTELLLEKGVLTRPEIQARTKPEPGGR